MTVLIIVLLVAGVALSVWLERHQARDPFWGRVLASMERTRAEAELRKRERP